MSIIQILSKTEGVLMKTRTMRAIKQGSSTVLALTGFLELGKEYLIKEVSEGKKNYIVITEAISDPIVPASVLRAV
jgi:hypothetical protein